MNSPSAPVAVIDVGSNTIKLLVARKGASGIETVLLRTCDARISRGISQDQPVLGEEGMAVGVEAIRSLLESARGFSPSRIELVATSAVRSAANGSAFCERVQRETGHVLRILSGDEEAACIGRGLGSDPALKGLGNFYVFDLGGGSMECLAFLHEKPAQELSLPLGCVRLTELFIKDPGSPIPLSSLDAIAAHTRRSLRESGFEFDLDDAKAVFAGGSMTTARAILAAAEGKTLEQGPVIITVRQLCELLSRLARMPLEQRRQSVPGLPAARADVFPTALATMISTAEIAGVEAFQHSAYNLRYGLASQLLAKG